jgi:hypothetical protein
MKSPRLIGSLLFLGLHPLHAEIARWADASIPATTDFDSDGRSDAAEFANGVVATVRSSESRYGW